jgi:hypothetical protein
MRVVERGADVADDLYTAQPSDFTRVRDALVRKLRSAGRDSIAKAVSQRRKPTIAVWALNQAARKAPGHVQAFLSALDRVKRAQLRQPNDLAPASESMRTAAARIVNDARNALQIPGTAWTPSLLRRVANTLRGAASDPAQRDQLLHGTLTDELTAPGFGVFGDARPTGTLRAVAKSARRKATEASRTSVKAARRSSFSR